MVGRFRKTVLQPIWGFLCSRRVTAALLLALGALLILGLGVPQMPGELDAAGQAQWGKTIQARYGDSAGWMARLGLFTLFDTPLFVALIGALLLNNLACTIERLGRLWRELARRPTVRLPEAAYRPAGPEALGLPAGQTLSGEQIRRALRRRGYRRSEETAGRHYFYGESPRLAAIGTLLTHTGLFLLALAALLHTQAAWRERLILNPLPTESLTLTHRPTCALRSDTLAAGRERGRLLSGEARLVIEEQGRATTGRIAPGAPLAACGVNLYFLDAYGLVLGVEAHDPTGNPLDVAIDGGPALRFFGREDAVSAFAVPAWGWRVAVSPSPEAMAGTPTGILALQVTTAAGETLTQSLKIGEDWTGPWGRLTLFGGQEVEIEAVHDPGVGPFLAGGAALALGSALGLLCPRRKRWARLDADGTLWLGGPSAEGETVGRGAP